MNSFVQKLINSIFCSIFFDLFNKQLKYIKYQKIEVLDFKALEMQQNLWLAEKICKW